MIASAMVGVVLVRSKAATATASMHTMTSHIGLPTGHPTTGGSMSSQPRPNLKDGRVHHHSSMKECSSSYPVRTPTVALASVTGSHLSRPMWQRIGSGHSPRPGYPDNSPGLEVHRERIQEPVQHLA